MANGVVETSKRPSPVATGSGTPDFEAKVRFRRGMSEAELADELIQLGFSRADAEAAAAKVYARRVTDLHKAGMEKMVTGGMTALLAGGFSLVTLLAATNGVGIYIGLGGVTAFGLFHFMLGLEQVMSARRDAGID